jgi:Skp family chaperone for outer membrane proteins
LRLQSEHAAEIAALQKEFDEEKARLLDDSHAELNLRIKELKRRLVTEYEKKLDELERKHKKELQRVSPPVSNYCFWES